MMKVKRVFQNNFSILKSFRKFAEIIPAPQSTQAVVTKPSDILNEIKKGELNLTAEEFNIALKTGSDLFIPADKLKAIQNAGFFFDDVNEVIDLEANSITGWRLQYLKNMLLLQDYNNIFRDFLQCCALNNEDGLKLTCENRFKEYIKSNLMMINKFGYNLEIDSLKIMQDYKVLRVELYKNLKVNRDENREFNKYQFKKVWTPLAPLVVAHQKGVDESIVNIPRPFILATTMLIRSPMKMAVFNQNMSRKIHGKPEQEVTDYVVRFESQLSYSDLFWVLPTQNKPNRIRQTRITDFNNVLRGNPYFSNKFDLVDESLRYSYMGQNERLDSNVRSLIL